VSPKGDSLGLASKGYGQPAARSQQRTSERFLQKVEPRYGSGIMSGRLDGQVAWISGATSGIGEATARLFAAGGAKVALVGRRLELGEKIAEQINVAGGQALAIACDVSQGDQVRDWFQRTLEYASAADCAHVTALPGVTFEGVAPSDSFGLCCDELAWRVEQAETAKIIFAVEAHIGSIVPTPGQAQRLVRSVLKNDFFERYSSSPLRRRGSAGAASFGTRPSPFGERRATTGGRWTTSSSWTNWSAWIPGMARFRISSTKWSRKTSGPSRI